MKKILYLLVCWHFVHKIGLTRRFKLLNILLVTSQVTYVPKNYQFLLEELAQETQGLENINLKAVVSLKSIDSALLKKIIALPLIGVFDLGKNLILNLSSHLLGKRDTLLKKHQIPHLHFEDLNDPKAIEWIIDNKIDLIINLRTRCLYKNSLLKSSRLGCINIHHGLLPKYRGTFCDLYALFENREAGFSIHHMEKKVDSGLIYEVVTVSHGEEKNYENYLKKAEIEEIRALKKLFKHLNDHQGLPEGQENICPQPIYTKNPTPAVVKAMRLKGMHL